MPTSRAAGDPRLPLDLSGPAALPRHLGPMYPRLGAAPFNAQNYIFEVKWDGVRALVAKDDGGLRVVDRHGGDLLARLPELANVAGQLPVGALLDAEVVVCDARGRPRYELLAGRLGPKAARRGAGPILLAFDLLYESYRPLLTRPLIERRERLAGLVGRPGRLVVPEHLESDGEPFFDAVCELELEGVVAKRRDSSYVPGARSSDWLKVYARPRMDVVVCGAVFEGERPRAVLCGQYREEALVAIGTAYVPPYLQAHVAERIAELERSDSPVDGPVDVPRGLRWLRPELCAMVELSGDGFMFKDARFRAFRIDGRPVDCRFEEALRVPSESPRLESGRPRLVVLRSLFTAEVS